MKKQSRSLSLSKETLYTLDSGSLGNAKGGLLPLSVTLIPPAAGVIGTIGIIIYETVAGKEN